MICRRIRWTKIKSVCDPDSPSAHLFYLLLRCSTLQLLHDLNDLEYVDALALCHQRMTLSLSPIFPHTPSSFELIITQPALHFFGVRGSLECVSVTAALKCLIRHKIVSQVIYMLITMTRLLLEVSHHALIRDPAQNGSENGSKNSTFQHISMEGFSGLIARAGTSNFV